MRYKRVRKQNITKYLNLFGNIGGQKFFTLLNRSHGHKKNNPKRPLSIRRKDGIGEEFTVSKRPISNIEVYVLNIVSRAAVVDILTGIQEIKGIGSHPGKITDGRGKITKNTRTMDERGQTTVVSVDYYAILKIKIRKTIFGSNLATQYKMICDGLKQNRIAGIINGARIDGSDAAGRDSS